MRRSTPRAALRGLLLAGLALTFASGTGGAFGAPSGRAGAYVPTIGAPVAATGITIVSFEAVPATVEVAVVTILYANVTGGAPPLTFAYGDLPIGCTSENTSELTCLPGQVQHFNVTVQVTDLAGDVATAATPLVVTSGHGMPPKVDSFTVSPTSVATQHLAAFSVVATSESSTPTSSLGYTYFDLPPGCATFNQTDLGCVPTSPGTYRIAVEVTDGFGSFTIANTTLTVTGAGPAPSGGGTTLPTIWIESLAAIALLGVVAAVLLIRSRRARRPPA